MSGISFQFLPKLESEARIMISNLLPYLHHHYGDIAKKCFIPSAVERLQECKWDPEAGTIIGAYDEEINYLDESDIMTQYITSKTASPHTQADLSTPTKPSATTDIFPSSGYINDEDSVSTLGNNTARKWSLGPTPSPFKPPNSVPHAITHTEKPPNISDDKSLGSVSTLNTRINSIEGQFQELSGTMEQIKQMLNLIANPRTAKDGDPRSLDNAGRGNSAGASS